MALTDPIDHEHELAAIRTLGGQAAKAVDLARVEQKVDDLTRRLDELLTRFGPMLERAEARFNRTPMFGRRGGQE